MEKKWFETWFDTQYYHILYNHRDEKEAAVFVDLLMEYFHLPPQSKVMDLACGKGRHAARMAEHDLDVTGVDLSENSIQEAQQLSDSSLNFSVHNMLDAWQGEKFDLVTNLFTSFGYFDSKEQNIQVLKNIENMLNVGGQFVIDFLNATKVKENLVPKETIQKERINFQIERKIENGKIIKDIQFQDQGETHHFQEQVQALTLSDFEQMSQKANLIITEVKGDYQLNDFDAKTSPRLILIGKVKV